MGSVYRKKQTPDQASVRVAADDHSVSHGKTGRDCTKDSVDPSSVVCGGDEDLRDINDCTRAPVDQSSPSHSTCDDSVCNADEGGPVCKKGSVAGVLARHVADERAVCSSSPASQ